MWLSAGYVKRDCQETKRSRIDCSAGKSGTTAACGAARRLHGVLEVDTIGLSGIMLLLEMLRTTISEGVVLWYVVDRSLTRRCGSFDRLWRRVLMHEEVGWRLRYL